jgi:hypothetical protein
MAYVNNDIVQTNLASDGRGLVTGGTALNNGLTLANASPAVRAAVYSQMMMEEIEDGFLPDGLHRDVSEFSDGSQIFIPQLGNVTVADITEGSAATASAPDISKLSLSINQYKGAMTAISDEMKQDSYLWLQIESSLPRKHLRAIKETYEADLLGVAATQQVAATTAWATGAYGVAQTGVAAGATINGIPHRFVASGTSGKFDLNDFISAKLSMDKANVPAEGRIAIVDPIVEATINSLIGANAFSNNQHWEGALETGFAKNMKFIGNIFGFDIYTSNRLATLGEEAIGTFSDMYDGVLATDVVTLGMKANLFMCVADDDVTPLMGAWRKAPSIEGDRNVPKRQDEFYSSARWGFGIQRPESLVVVASSATAY